MAIEDAQLTIAEVARNLGIHPGAVRTAISRGRMQADRLGGSDAKAGMLLVRRSEMEHYRRTKLGKRGKRGPRVRQEATATSA